MITGYEIRNNGLSQSISEDCPVLVYINPTADERQQLMTKYEIDYHTLSSALDPDEISRIEFSDDDMYIIWKRPANYSALDSFFFNVESLGLFLVKEHLVVVIPEEIQLSLNEGKHHQTIVTILDALLAYFYNSIHHYMDHLKVIKLVAKEIQDKIYISMENEYLIQMFNLSESLVFYLNAINGNNGVLIKLRNYAEKHRFPEVTIELIDDIMIENNQCYKQAEIYSSIFAGLMEALSSLVNNNMNMQVKKLTMINVVFMPLTLLASIGGMSEYSMMTEKFGWKVSYPFFIGVMIAIGYVTTKVLSGINSSGNSRRKKKKQSKPAKIVFF